MTQNDETTEIKDARGTTQSAELIEGMADAHVASWLREKAFLPTMKFNRSFRMTPEMLVPWHVLDAWIPRRVNWWIEQLR